MKNTLKLVAGLALSGLFLTAHAQTTPTTMPAQDGKMMDGKMKDGKMKGGKMQKEKMGKMHKEKMADEKMKTKM